MSARDEEDGQPKRTCSTTRHTKLLVPGKNRRFSAIGTASQRRGRTHIWEHRRPTRAINWFRIKERRTPRLGLSAAPPRPHIRQSSSVPHFCVCACLRLAAILYFVGGAIHSLSPMLASHWLRIVRLCSARRFLLSGCGVPSSYVWFKFLCAAGRTKAGQDDRVPPGLMTVRKPFRAHCGDGRRVRSRSTNRFSCPDRAPFSRGSRGQAASTAKCGRGGPPCEEDFRLAA